MEKVTLFLLGRTTVVDTCSFWLGRIDLRISAIHVSLFDVETAWGCICPRFATFSRVGEDLFRNVEPILCCSGPVFHPSPAFHGEVDITRNCWHRLSLDGYHWTNKRGHSHGTIWPNHFMWSKKKIAELKLINTSIEKNILVIIPQNSLNQNSEHLLLSVSDFSCNMADLYPTYWGCWWPPRSFGKVSGLHQWGEWSLLISSLAKQRRERPTDARFSIRFAVDQHTVFIALPSPLLVFRG